MERGSANILLTRDGTFGPADEPASGLTRADIVTSSCRTPRLGYQYGAKGAVQAMRPFVADLGVVVVVSQTYGGHWQGDPATPPFHPGPSQVVVLHNSHGSIVSAPCVG